MKLKLNKQNITSLSAKEMDNVIGGGEGWSGFRTGHCNYSAANPAWGTLVDSGKQVLVGCKHEVKTAGAIGAQ
jgi:natural product precursor